MNKSTSNYEHIEALGKQMVEGVASRRPSAVLDFAGLHTLWSALERQCAAYGYDVLKARMADSHTSILLGVLRGHLMWISAVLRCADNTLLHPDSTELRKVLFHLAQEDAEVLRIKGATYGDSWRKRGGVGAFMMLARKWDRIENILQEFGGAMLARQLRANPGDVQDDIHDLRRYLLLIEDAHDHSA